jgi:hypothetical protein
MIPAYLLNIHYFSHRALESVTESNFATVSKKLISVNAYVDQSFSDCPFLG